MATSRFKRVSRARYTSPIPPAPSGATISYEPSLDPGESATLGSLPAVAGALDGDVGALPGLRELRIDRGGVLVLALLTQALGQSAQRPSVVGVQREVT